MAASIMGRVKNALKKRLKKDIENSLFFPFGNIGLQVEYVLNHAYDIQEHIFFED